MAYFTLILVVVISANLCLTLVRLFRTCDEKNFDTYRKKENQIQSIAVRLPIQQQARGSLLKNHKHTPHTHTHTHTHTYTHTVIVYRFLDQHILGCRNCIGNYTLCNGSWRVCSQLMAVEDVMRPTRHVFSLGVCMYVCTVTHTHTHTTHM